MSRMSGVSGDVGDCRSIRGDGSCRNAVVLMAAPVAALEFRNGPTLVFGFGSVRC